MSRIDDYEYQRRGRYPYRKGGQKHRKKPPQKGAVQLQMKLLGGTTDKDKGVAFDDDISHIG
jgi:hypothetical protein